MGVPGHARIWDRPPAAALATVFIMGAISTASAEPASKAVAAIEWPDPIQSDVNVTGPYLQPHSSDPHDPQKIDRCGEPQITQDALHPDTLIINCMSHGDLNYQSPAPASYSTWSYKDPTQTVPWKQLCHVFISRDGGKSWAPILPTPIDSSVVPACEDALAASGPHGELYLGGDDDVYPTDGKISPVVSNPSNPIFGQGANPIQEYGIAFTRSLDGGKTWSPTIVLPTAVDRPFWTVDQSNGVIYDLSGCVGPDPVLHRGAFGCTSTSRNLAVSTDQGQTWSPSVDPFNTLPPTKTLTSGRLHDIGGSFIAAAQGIVATAGAGRGGEEEGGMGSLASLYFKYSTDQGRTFTRVPMQLTRSACRTVSVQGVAANPARKGEFAVLLTCARVPTSLHVYVTRDLGKTWTEAADLAVVPPSDYRGRPSDFNVNRPWIAYGPSGALGVLWRQAYGTPPLPPRGSVQFGPQDVFLALARDGVTFGQPIRLNTAASPPPDPRIEFGDDISNLVLDGHHAYAVWGDWRSGELQTWFRKVPIPGS